MTAGRGIVHSEMPVVTDGEDLHGFQAWINLPSKQKMVKPRYQDIQKEDIPVVDAQGASIRVIAGKSGGQEGPMKLRNPGTLLDVRLDAGAEWRQVVSNEWNAFAYVYEGDGKLGGTKVDIQHAYVFGKDGEEVVSKAGQRGLKFLLFAGKPINEPVVQYGPFVMNTGVEIQQAFHDYRSGKLHNHDDDPWVDDDEL